MLNKTISVNMGNMEKSTGKSVRKSDQSNAVAEQAVNETILDEKRNPSSAKDERYEATSSR